MKVGSLLKGAVLAVACVFSAQTYAQEEASAAPVVLDEVVLENGSRILGTVVSARDGVVVIETDFAGTLSIALSAVKSMNTQGSLVLQLADGTVVRDKPIALEEETLVVVTDTGSENSYTLNDIRLLNPEPWELGEGYKPFGTVSFAWSMQEGNTDTEHLDFKLDAVWRSLEDRFTLLADAGTDETDGDKSAENWRIAGKYDYFLEGNDYWGWKISAEQDKFADLDMRAYTGPYYGRDFYTESIFTLRGELGLSYVTEDFIVADDTEYVGANWNLQASSDYLGGASILYINHEGIWNLKDTDSLVLNTSFGLAFPLLFSLEAAAEILLEYDSAAPRGFEKLDQTYRLRIGYAW